MEYSTTLCFLRAVLGLMLSPFNISKLVVRCQPTLYRYEEFYNLEQYKDNSCSHVDIFRLFQRIVMLWHGHYEDEIFITSIEFQLLSVSTLIPDT
jgi:hypothetical protein